jgi:hypothetical protein
MLTLTAGTILAIVMTFSQLINFPGEKCAKIKTEQTQSESDEAPQTCISIPTFSLPTSVHLKPNLDAQFLFEILFESETHTEYVELEVEAPTRFFATLFRVIISPNAP